MKIYSYLLRIVIFWFMTRKCACAGQKNYVDSVTSYNAGETATNDHEPLVPQYKRSENSPEAESRNHVRFDDEPPGVPVKFEDTPDAQTSDATVISENILIAANENNLIITVDDNFDYEDNHKFRFEGNHDHSTNNDNIESENDTRRVIFDETKLNDSKSNLEDIDFENEGTANINVEQNFSKYVQNSVESERVVFEDSQKIKEPIRFKKRPIKRKPRVQFKEGTRNPNAAYPGLRKPNYPPNYAGSGPGFPGAYPGYPNRYPLQGSPGGFPGYPSQATYPNHPNYLAYQPGYNQGYGLHHGNQAPEKPYPQGNIGQSNSKYPTSAPARPGTYPEQENSGVYSQQPGYPGYPQSTGPSGNGGYGFADGNSQYGQYSPRPDYAGASRPPRRQKSFPERAVSAVAEALTSIALYDDKQCVPRLLCEVASGSTSTSPTLLKATAGLGPLLTVLQAYNGMSTSPLFLFGRAAVLGMTSKGNPTSCRYAYSQCPNSPDALLDYLNNHNGGFFRFFGQPEGNKQQNLEQFYNHLAGQYGYLQQPQLQQQVNQQPSYSQQRPYQNQGYPQQKPGYLQQQPGNLQQQPYPPPQNYQQQQAYQQSNYPQKQGYPPQQNYPHNPYSYGYGSQSAYPQNYGPNYLYAYRNALEAQNDSETALSNIEERIQNKPGVQAIEDDEEKEDGGSKWAFPDETSGNIKENKRKQRKLKAKRPESERLIRADRGGSKLKFPDENEISEVNFDVNRENDFTRTQKDTFFPSQNYFNVHASYQTTPGVNLEEYVFDHKNNFFVKRPQLPVNNDADFVYIVRGNGDPNHPEVIQVRPGQNSY